MDGVDAALVRLSGTAEKPSVRLLAFTTLPYPREVKGRILRVAAGEKVSTGEISQLNFLLGELFADAALKVCRRGKVAPRQLSVIGSHGQTIYHQGAPSVEGGRQVASTLQIAEPAVIAARTGATVVGDFRTADIAAGGQGAPLVPMLDYLLLNDPSQGTVALNLGGIANLTAIPAGARPRDVLGFDTGPGNMVLDSLVRHFTEDRKAYDAGGRVGKSGKVDGPILSAALQHPFFLKKPPKSAGREEFGEPFVRRYFLTRRRLRFEDALRTATELTARTIADALDRFVFPRASFHRMIISGGGAHNLVLVKRLRELNTELTVVVSGKYGLPVDAKEAIAFAVLADRTLHGLPGNLPAVTGARQLQVLGKMARPQSPQGR